MFQYEEWAHINGYDGLYIISNLGRVKRYKKGYWKTLKPTKNNHGYLTVQLSKNGKVSKYKIHRLVALHFIPNLENKSEVNHIDENKENNAVSNLEWTTHKENLNHGTRNERASKTMKEKFKNGDYRRKRTKKVSCYDIVSGDFIQEFESMAQASYELKNPTYGYYWSYEKKDNFFD